jgi:hypothetical protein
MDLKNLSLPNAFGSCAVEVAVKINKIKNKPT